MKSSTTFFVIRDARQNDNGTLRIDGQLIMNGTVTVVDSPSSQPDDNPPRINLELLTLFEAKWILPPAGTGAYGAIKAFAESMGYSTVELDDFSYPERAP